MDKGGSRERTSSSSDNTISSFNNSRWHTSLIGLKELSVAAKMGYHRGVQETGKHEKEKYRETEEKEKEVCDKTADQIVTIHLIIR